MVRGYSIKFAARSKKSRDLKLTALEKKLLDLEIESSKSCQLFQDNKIQKSRINKEIEEIRMYKTQGAMLRSAADWMEYGEKSSRLFFALEKSRATKKIIQKLQVGEDPENIADTKDEVLHEIHAYYEKLFDLHQVNEDSDFLDDLKVPQVKLEDKIILDAPIQLDEVIIAIKQLSEDKCPGVP